LLFDAEECIKRKSFSECFRRGSWMGKVKKIFIQRDYSRGTAVRFATDFPRELTGKVKRKTVPQIVYLHLHRDVL